MKKQVGSVKVSNIPVEKFYTTIIIGNRMEATANIFRKFIIIIYNIYE